MRIEPNLLPFLMHFVSHPQNPYVLFGPPTHHPNRIENHKNIPICPDKLFHILWLISHHAHEFLANHLEKKISDGR
jgi:hypothetical protein